MQLALLAAAGIGLSLGILGSGGSVLALPLLVYLAGQDVKQAIAGSLFIVAMISLATLLFSPAKRQINWRLAWQLGISGALGGYIGAYAGQFVHPLLQLLIFATLMLIAAQAMWRHQETTANHSSTYVIVIAGTLAGALTSFTGAGGGFMLVPVLVRFAGQDFFHARATSLLLIFSNAVLALLANLKFQSNWQLDWTLLLAISALGIIGSLSGRYWSASWSQQRLRRGFALLLVIIALFIVGHSLLEVI
ncbi:sulfite exporter TauE/SafE family protein [Bowmanella denitrificans]|uniref:Probable membrane transporter protein n=1 Tax=Bowmanella denitrificans TaxID=366582 RepID=A0ABN0XJN1_9ALTE